MHHNVKKTSPSLLTFYYAHSYTMIASQFPSTQFGIFGSIFLQLGSVLGLQHWHEPLTQWQIKGGGARQILFFGHGQDTMGESASDFMMHISAYTNNTLT